MAQYYCSTLQQVFEVISCLVPVHWPNLLTLQLAMTMHDERAAEKLLDDNRPLLHTLDLSSNRLDKRFFETLRIALQGNQLRHLKHLTDTFLNLAAV